MTRPAAIIIYSTENEQTFNTCMDGNINSSWARILQMINTVARLYGNTPQLNAQKIGISGCVADVIICCKFSRNQLRGF